VIDWMSPGKSFHADFAAISYPVGRTQGPRQDLFVNFDKYDILSKSCHDVRHAADRVREMRIGLEPRKAADNMTNVQPE